MLQELKLSASPLAGVMLLLLLGHVVSEAQQELCEWIASSRSMSSLDELERHAPSSCVLQSEFFTRLNADADKEIKTGSMSPEAAGNWVMVWSSFVPTFEPTIGGLTKTYKCVTKETTGLYTRLLAAIVSAAKNKDVVSHPVLDKIRGGKFIVLDGGDANIDGGLYRRHALPDCEALSSPNVIASPFNYNRGQLPGVGGLAVYTVSIPIPGTFKMFVRARSFSPSGASFKVSNTIFGQPKMMISIPYHQGQLAWTEVTTALVREEGLLRLMIASHSALVQIDTIVLHSAEGNYNNHQLNYLTIASSGIALEPKDANLGTDPAFELLARPDTISQRVLSSLDSGADPAMFTLYLASKRTYTVYLLARALKGDAHVQVYTEAYRGSSHLWNSTAFTWKAVGLCIADTYKLMNMNIQGANIEISAIFLHINPNLIQIGGDVLAKAVAQSISFDTVCGNGIKEFTEDCDGGPGCQNCKCASGYRADGGRCHRDNNFFMCGNGIVDDGEECDGTEYCDQSCTCSDESTAEYGSCVVGFRNSVPVECGNGIVERGEECDDTLGCEKCRCVDGYVLENEHCVAICGNGLVQFGEECDDENSGCEQCQCARGYGPGDQGCVQFRYCGNGNVDEGEECDGGIGCENCRCSDRYISHNGGCVPQERRCQFADPCNGRSIDVAALDRFEDGCRREYKIDINCEITTLF